jgi:hypothetical protein
MRKVFSELSSEELRSLEVALKKIGKRAAALMEQWGLCIVCFMKNSGILKDSCHAFSITLRRRAGYVERDRLDRDSTKNYWTLAAHGPCAASARGATAVSRIDLR